MLPTVDIGRPHGAAVRVDRVAVHKLEQVLADGEPCRGRARLDRFTILVFAADRHPDTGTFTRVSHAGRSTTTSAEKALAAIGVSRIRSQLCFSTASQVVAKISDNGISALRGRYRPGYERRSTLWEQTPSSIIVRQTSRLLHSRKERAEAIELPGTHPGRHLDR